MTNPSSQRPHDDGPFEQGPLSPGPPPEERGPTAPRPDPEPGPESLGEDVDWMTYSHQRLYQMANEGVDVAGAHEVSVTWAKIGQKLEDIGGDLKRAMAGSVHGWRGAAAERARESVQQLITWSNDTGTTAGKVANCIAIEADHAEHMRAAMPPPVVVRTEDPDFPDTVPPQTAGGTSPMSAGDFGSAQALPNDSMPSQQSQRVAHQQAADVMRNFQRGSNDVYGTVPKFASPTGSERLRRRKPDHDPRPRPKPGEDDTTTSTSSVDTGTPGAGGGGAAGAAGAAAAGGAAGGAMGAGMRTGQDPPSLSGGARTGAGEGAAAAARGPAGAGAGAGRAMPMGGVPMGAGMGQRGGQEDDRKAPGYLEEDSDIWKVEGKVAPPVIGEDPNRA